MQRITAVLHTYNDALRLGRCLETLYPCDEILVVDHGSSDDTVQVASEYGASIIRAKAEASLQSYLQGARAAWILCLDSRESLTEALAASLYEWKTELVRTGVSSFSVLLREETPRGWIEHSEPQTRLVPANWNRWSGPLPANDPRAIMLQGEILRFAFP